ncbi:uncharacterized protein ARB_00731 [Trichophyton benhamiae CBS 112371]|uniref:Uncharacterized protein n=2 Tax=Trichophyton TaxID=5550 RepID=D4AX14_ARTBC|nr:uncharacterized protein ARB_00731 [Trichophyton benhamiae CBS 112371]XP_003025661.1 uncharacterized protein TRV_00184 [Trichophyton verrucosum HKI 0517]EFE32545.1 hypothetical protein ARB_00731 [Trichophyton benhamiae CBS 112371]EFE45050.1 hypothetical protein TRV_00184 [Trichophyton verrucosum HKI 0517]
MEEVFSGIKYAFDYLFRSRAARGLPDDRKCRVAYWLMDYVQCALCHFRSEVKTRYPHRVDIIDIAEKVERSIIYEHGGMEPKTLLRTLRGETPRSKPLTPEGLKTCDQILARWQDHDAIKKEFYFLKLDRIIEEGFMKGSFVDDDDVLLSTYLYDTEKHASQTANGMKKWLLARHGTLEF